MLFQLLAFAGIIGIALIECVLMVSGVINAASARHAGTIAGHKIYARVLLALTVLLVGIIEAKVRMDGGVQAVDGLFITHLCFAIPFLAGLIVLNKWLTGEKKPQWHWKVAIATLILSVGTLATAVPMIFRL